MEAIKEKVLLPSYREILAEMGKQIYSRKGILLKRIIYIAWPLIVIFALIPIIALLQKKGIIALSSDQVILIGLLFAVGIILGTIYYSFARLVFFIEKRIWIDSFFDKKELSPDDSWRIARKLFWSSIKLRGYVFFRYYGIGFGLYFLAIVGYIVLMAAEVVPFHWIAFLVIVLGGAFLLWLYAYYMRLKLRYTWFVFLDRFGSSDFSNSQVVKEAKKLSEMSQTESFKKALVITLGTDSLTELIDATISILCSQLGRLGDEGKIAGNVLAMVGQEYTNQAMSYGEIAAMYMLYQVARQELYHEQQLANEYLYNLK